MRPRQLHRTAGVALGLAIFASLPAAPSYAGGGSTSSPGCIDNSSQQASAAGGDSGPPTFSPGFLRTTFSVDVSTDGFAGHDLTISIETLCRVPKAYTNQAIQLAGSDGVAVISSRTRVYKGKRLLKGATRRAEIDGADTMRLTVRLVNPKKWRAGEDQPVPTFTTRRADITD